MTLWALADAQAGGRDRLAASSRDAQQLTPRLSTATHCSCQRYDAGQVMDLEDKNTYTRRNRTAPTVKKSHASTDQDSSAAVFVTA